LQWIIAKRLHIIHSHVAVVLMVIHQGIFTWSESNKLMNPMLWDKCDCRWVKAAEYTTADVTRTVYSLKHYYMAQHHLPRVQHNAYPTPKWATCICQAQEGTSVWTVQMHSLRLYHYIAMMYICLSQCGF
jgi:hypothetical protein